jgi:hypothetical protein
VTDADIDRDGHGMSRQSSSKSATTSYWCKRKVRNATSGFSLRGAGTGEAAGPTLLERTTPSTEPPHLIGGGELGRLSRRARSSTPPRLDTRQPATAAASFGTVVDRTHCVGVDDYGMALGADGLVTEVTFERDDRHHVG